MPQFMICEEIRAEPNRVFEVFVDLKNIHERVTSLNRVELLTPGDIGLGSRVRITRTMNEKAITELMEVTEFVPGHSYTIGGKSHGTRFGSRYEFNPITNGTRVYCTTGWEAMTLKAKLASPMALLMKNLARKCLTEDINDLKRWIEANPEPKRESA